MTPTTTALQALEQAAAQITEAVSGGHHILQRLSIALKCINAARAALSAPAAQDAPSEREAFDAWLNSPADGIRGDVAARHMTMTAIQQECAREGWMARAARASQPATPAPVDAAATVQVPPAGAGAKTQAVPISELQQHAAEAAAIVSKLYNDTPDVSTAVQAGAWMQRAVQYLAATPAAHPVAGQGQAGWKLVPVEPTREMIHAALADCSLPGDADDYIEIWRLMLNAAPTAPQAQAPVGGQDERAWLVEWKAHGYGPQWWGFTNTPGKKASWCEDANSAIRFARREDAERMRLHIIAVSGLTGLHDYERSITATEHEWPAVQSGHSMPTAPQAPALVPLTDAQMLQLQAVLVRTMSDPGRSFALPVDVVESLKQFCGMGSSNTEGRS